MRKAVFEHGQYAQIKIHPMDAQSHPGIFSPLIYSIMSYDYVSGQQMPWPDVAHAQTDLGLRYLQMSEDTFSRGMAHLKRLFTY